MALSGTGGIDTGFIDHISGSSPLVLYYLEINIGTDAHLIQFGNAIFPPFPLDPIVSISS